MNIQSGFNYSEPIEIYKQVITGRRQKFPSNTWDKHEGYRNAKEITQFLFEKILNWSIEDIKNEVNEKVFVDNYLGGMLSVLFNGSYHLALMNAYPDEDWGYSEYNSVKRNTYTKQELIIYLKEKALELGRTPTIKDLTRPSVTPFYNVFESWNEALKQADLEINQETREVKEYDKQELIDNIRNKTIELNRVPLNVDMIDPDVNVYARHFGSWKNALKAAGLEKKRLKDR